MLLTTAVRPLLILAHWSCPVAHLQRAGPYSTEPIALNQLPPGGRAGRCARVRKENVPIALRRQFQLRWAVIPMLLAHEKLCARQGALGDEAGHQHGNQQAAADSDQPEHLSKSNSGMHAHTHALDKKP